MNTESHQRRWPGDVGSILFVLLSWQILAWIIHQPYLPSPLAVIYAMGDFGFLYKMGSHLLYSLGRVSCGIAIAILIGVPIGYLMGYTNKVDRLLSPLVYFTYPIPKLALLPIVMLLFGFGELSKLTMIVLIVIFQLIISARDAVRGIPAEIFRSVRSLGANRWQLFQEIIIPATMGEILTSSRLGLGTALSVLFFTETYGTVFGMGYFIMDAWMRHNYLEMYGGIVLLSFMGFLLFRLIDLLENKVCAWR